MESQYYRIYEHYKLWKIIKTYKLMVRHLINNQFFDVLRTMFTVMRHANVIHVQGQT